MSNTIPVSFPALIASDSGDGKISSAPGSWKRDNLPAEGVDIRIDYSCLNYKDALSAMGNRGVSPNYPHIPGIDAAGIRLDTGEPVVITGFDFGMGSPGGFSRYSRVPESWLLPLPDGLSSVQAMAYGTAGVTAAMCVQAILDNGKTAQSGPVVVSGATGGVGSVALGILANLGFEVHAVSRKAAVDPQAASWLKELGAIKIIETSEFTQKSEKALLRPEYAGAVDNVGGEVLHRMLRSLQFGGTAALCGMVGGTSLESNIFPFILRDVRLVGIASADSSPERKAAMWKKLAGSWRLKAFETSVKTVNFSQLPEEIDRTINGNQQGRVVVSCA